MIPLERSGTPEDAAGAVYLFCIPESDYVSAQTLVCSGGLLIQRFRPGYGGTVNSPATELNSRPPLRTSPRNRRQLILTAAADLFAQKGYSSVAMADIAAAVAVRPSALYRHYRGKEELLYTVVHDALASVRSSIDRTDLRSIASVLLDHRELGLLW